MLPISHEIDACCCFLVFESSWSEEIITLLRANHLSTFQQLQIVYGASERLVRGHICK